ncbi:hypothetical protein CUJ83_03950 [Methanocella sp. CWC-04]|uniref:Uncharacterized protein n=1 Tax=Methanooceanicella nereidis TaxID=2052831 RepID=A0AAP2W6I4_9EURY|nr:hypothetical protein [Methanocella sp. CWC-04]MCD1294146.1 hypothetical protein [Methanocella sp. CWC-04]
MRPIVVLNILLVIILLIYAQPANAQFCILPQTTSIPFVTTCDLFYMNPYSVGALIIKEANRTTFASGHEGDLILTFTPAEPVENCISLPALPLIVQRQDSFMAYDDTYLFTDIIATGSIGT